MSIPKIFENTTTEEQANLDAMRDWVSSIATANQTVSVAGKLNLIQVQISAGGVTSKNVWKLAALGLLFGDALHQSFEGRLKWVMVQDKHGTSPALRWKSTEHLVFPISTLRSRIQSGEPVDIHALFTEYADLFPFQRR